MPSSYLRIEPSQTSIPTHAPDSGRFWFEIWKTKFSNLYKASILFFAFLCISIYEVYASSIHKYLLTFVSQLTRDKSIEISFVLFSFFVFFSSIYLCACHCLCMSVCSWTSSVFFFLSFHWWMFNEVKELVSFSFLSLVRSFISISLKLRKLIAFKWSKITGSWK